ncbi:LysM peptidoglycan-binding domain-containing protein [Patiriisocius sp. Uisw_017]|jgi:LysM repeat protein|uniref:LysM peptidoglycan-binding domain-containing protein n=1 Tax=Patiriisocius sp. Uisw_017 TaxID=3230968 RepID=UPI0039E7C321
MKYLLYLVFAIAFNVSSSAQEAYKTHRVLEDETLGSIAKMYGISSDEITKLNPGAGLTPSENTMLVLPSKVKDIQQPLKFKKHRVRRKETLFGISKKYNVSVADIKRYNKELYARSLKKGERLKIPQYPEKSEIPVVVTPGPPLTTVSPKPITTGLSKLTVHTVKPKETKYGIARMYGITLQDFEKINPLIGNGLSIGQMINVPAETIMETAIPEEGYILYVVQPKEGFYRLKVKTGLTQEEIVALNPYAKVGLKEGMILKIPKSAAESVTEETALVNLENSVTNTSTKSIAVLLPFRLNKTIDSTNTKSDVIRNDKLMSLSLDFYSGVIMATEFAKDKGISSSLKVYDTEYSTSKVGSIIASNDFKNFDAVIGPLGQKQVERAASLLKNNRVPVFSPLSNKEIKISKNLFQTLPEDDMLEDGMIQFIKARSEGKNILIISDSKHASQKAKLLSKLPGSKTAAPREKGFLYVKDIDDQINKTTENWVILESDDPVIVSNVVGILNGMPPEYKLRLFSLKKGIAYDYHDVSNLHLAKLNFTFPSVNKNYNYKDPVPFLISYKNKYGVLPNKYAVRGFDLMYDVLLRLASADDIYEATEADFETAYIENKFRYSKKFLSGYQNNAFYIIKYKEDLQLEVIE